MTAGAPLVVLAVDGGQSGIRIRSSAGDRTVEIGGVSHLEGDTVAQVAAAVADGYARGRFGPVDRVVLGLTTAPIASADSDRLCGLIAGTTGALQVWLMDDAVTSHAGALSGGWGISLVVGTGVACLVVPRDRTDARLVDGHGFLLGDDGGGFWLGSRGLRAVLRAADGRGAVTRLTDHAIERFGEIEGLHVRLHRAGRAVNAIAQFARDVLIAADEGDDVAEQIVNDAVGQLALTVMAAHDLAAPGDASVRLALGGRLVESGGILRRRLHDRVRRELPTLQVRSADHGALEGAIHLGTAGLPGEYRALVHVWREETAP